MKDYPSVSELYKKFPGENTCRSYFAQQRWGSEPVVLAAAVLEFGKSRA